MPQFDQYVTIACVCNQVGGNLVGNALWTGVDLRAVLDMAGVQPGARPRSWAARWTASPSASRRLGDGPGARADDRPGHERRAPARRPWLSRAPHHPRPVRLRQRHQVAHGDRAHDLEGFDAYWVPLGWAKEAPDPHPVAHRRAARRRTVPAGPRSTIAGVAWAPDRGVTPSRSRSTAAMDARQLSVPLNDATWVQWQLPGPRTRPGACIRVRATDGDGVVQTEERTAPAPDGARGHHTISVVVTCGGRRRAPSAFSRDSTTPSTTVKCRRRPRWRRPVLADVRRPVAPGASPGWRRRAQRRGRCLRATGPARH